MACRKLCETMNYIFMLEPSRRKKLQVFYHLR